MTISAPVAAPGSARVTSTRRYLMCPPVHFDVAYRINPWMRPDRPVDRSRAVAQWTRLRDELTALGHQVDVMPPQPHLPDLVFTANGGIAIGAKALVPRFRHPERAPESEHFAIALRNLGIADVRTASCVNEGEGDFRLAGARILAGYGLRSDRRAAGEVAEFFGLPVVPLRLVDPRFYHLDTALAVLDERTVAYWPGAFDEDGNAALRELFPAAIVAAEADAAQLGLNMVSDGSTVIMSPECPALGAQIAERGFDVVQAPSDELRKAGGGAKCCVLEWHSPIQERSR
jgi:N-dimethylarginine dimethylaminohydrolase